MANEYDVVSAQMVKQFVDVCGVPLQRLVLGEVIGGQVRVSAADMVEKDGSEPGAECRCHAAPHGLITAEPMRKDHRRVAFAGDPDIVSFPQIHASFIAF